MLDNFTYSVGRVKRLSTKVDNLRYNAVLLNDFRNACNALAFALINERCHFLSV